MNHKPAPPQNRTFAKSMRSAMTEAELKLWNEVRGNRLMGMKFRRQMPIGGYIADFACPSLKLIVEIDGSQHGRDGKLRADASRSAALENLGWEVLRFWNDDVLKDIGNVCQHIVLVAEQRKTANQRR